MLSDEAASPAKGGAWVGSTRMFLVLGSVTVIGPASMDIYLPGLPALALDLGVSASMAQLTVTTFLLGLALGQLVGGPLSDVYGRRQPLIGGLAIYSFVSLLCVVAPSLLTLATLRFVQGATASVGFVVGRAVVRDLYSGAAAARFLSQLMLIVGLGPILAPVLGAQILGLTSWRGVFVALALLGLVLLVSSAWFLPETLPPERRSAGGLAATGRTLKGLSHDRGFVGLVLVAALAGGAMVGYVAGSSFVLQDVYGISPQAYSLLFGMNAVFMVLGAQTNSQLLIRQSPRRLLGFGVSAMAVAGCALLLAVAGFPHAGMAAVLPPLALVTFSWSFTQANAIALALTDHPHEAGTSAALFGVGVYAAGAVTAPLVSIGGRYTAVPMAIVIGACSIAALVALRHLIPRSGAASLATTSPGGR